MACERLPLSPCRSGTHKSGTARTLKRNGGAMLKRTIVFASAVVVTLAAAMIASVGASFAQSAADDCLAKPNGAAPKGQHWYYRLERPGNRRCWYLGAEGAKPRQASLPKPKPAAEAAPRPEPVPRPARVATAAPEAPPIRTVTTAAAAEPDGESAAFMLAAPLSTGMRPFNVKPAPATDGVAPAAAVAVAASADSTPPLQATVPAQPPIPAAPPASDFTPWHLLALVAVALVLVMVARRLAQAMAARRLRRQRMALREQWQAQAPPPWKSVPADSGEANEFRPQRHRARAAPRTAEVPPTAPRRAREAAVEANDEVEAGLHQLLRDWQRVAA